MLVTPFCWHFSNSDAFIAREAPVMSGCCSPTQPQNSCMPPPVPVDSTTGAGNSPARPKFSATAVDIGSESCRVRECKYVKISLVAAYFKKNRAKTMQEHRDKVNQCKIINTSIL